MREVYDAEKEHLRWLVAELTEMPPSWTDTHAPGLKLSPQQSLIFSRLLKSKGKFVPFASLWAAANSRHRNIDEASASNLVTVQVRHIRRRLESVSAPYRIDNLWGVGYRVVDA